MLAITALGVCLVVLAGVLHCSARHRNQNLPELAVDLLYLWAMFWGCLAEACDAGLLRFRKTRQEIRSAHRPMYRSWMEGECSNP